MSYVPFILATGAAQAAAGAPTTSSYLGAWFNGNNQASFSFTSTPFGPAATNRMIVMILASNGSGGSPTGPSSVTIGGVAATRDANQSGNTGENIYWAAYSAMVPTGTSGTIAINYATGNNYNHPTFSAYALNNTSRAPAFVSAAGAFPSGGTSTSLTMTMQAGFAYGGAREASAYTAGLTLDYFMGEWYNWAFGSAAVTAGSLTVTVNRNVSSGSLATQGGNLFVANYR